LTQRLAYACSPSHAHAAHSVLVYRYAQHQLQQYKERVIPQDQWVGPPRIEAAAEYQWSALGRKLVGIDPWELSQMSDSM
jgi:hypothetical protein